jgi:hypothetical protein
MPSMHPRAVRQATRDIAAFSEHVLARPLRPYQAVIARAIVAGVLSGRGATFSVLMARQMGKNELLL